MTAESEAPDIPGYRIEAVLGHGATGVVYRARQISVDRVVALKVLHRELVGARRAEQRLQREARTTARLAHPNIISAIDMGEVGGVWWYAMELVDGVSLQERLREGPLTEREALRLFIPLVEALQHAFERGVVHRDIKPGNILVERGGRPRLVDLGLAVADDDPLLTKGGGTLGTPHYISPEQARDPRSADVQSDLWSLGATLYHAACGRPPFTGESVAEILSAVLYARVTDPGQLAPYLSRGFALVLRKCLTRDRSHRYATPAELLADLERVRERRAPKVSRAGLDPVLHDWRPARRPALLSAVGVLVIAGVVLVVRSLGGPAQLPSEASGAPSAPDPIGVLEGAASGPAEGLAAALARAALLETSGSLDAETRARLARARQQLTSRIESEVWSFEREAEGGLARLLADRDFAGCERSIAGGFASDLAARLGPARLPDSLREGFERWVAVQGEKLRDERERILARLGPAIGQHVQEKVLPRVDELVARGDWKSARDLLTFSPAACAAEAGIELRGLSDGEVERATDPVRAVLDQRRNTLDEAWKKLDADLRAWVERRVSGLRDALIDRTQRDASARLRADWDAELSARGLSVERMPIGVARLAHEELAKGAARLDEVERKVADEDARLRLSYLEQETLPLWRERRYAEIEAAYAEAATEPWSAAFEDRIGLPAMEARRLEAFLRRAVEGIGKSHDRSVTLQLGTLGFTGRLLAGADPLLEGIRMRPDRGQELAFAVKGPSTKTALLPGAALEALAGLPSADQADPAERVVLALFRWREGEPGSVEAARAARAALDAGPLPPDDPLLRELERRIATALAGAETPEGARRSRAVEKLRLLRGELLEGGSREKKLKRIDDLLLQFGRDLQPDELAEVRTIRNAIVLESTPSTTADFQREFRLPAEQIELSGTKPRATLRFEFGSASAGSFDRGAWTADGKGWIAPRNARTDEELLAGPAPTLLLRDPLRLQSETFEIRILFEQPPDSPPDLLLVSAAGFQVVLVGTRRPRCLVETGGPALAVAHARATEGQPFEGLDRGATYELRLALNRSGKALVDLRKRGIGRAQVDGEWKRLIEILKLAPRGDEKALALSVRSFEPVRLLQVTVDAARR